MSKSITLLEHDGKYRTQEEAIEFHNARKESFVSVSVAINLVDNKQVDDISKLRQDFDDYWLMTSTCYVFGKGLSGKIIHNVKSIVVKEKVIELEEIPVCQPAYLKPLLDTISGLKFVRALIDQPNASKEQIISKFEALSGKDAGKIRFWTPTESGRRDSPVRAVTLCFNVFGRFVVDGYGWFGNDYGFSRGVLVKSAKQTRFLSNKAIFDIEEKTITIPMQFDELYVMKGDTTTSAGVKREMLIDAQGIYIARSRLKADGKLKDIEEPDIKKLLKKIGKSTEDKPKLSTLTQSV